MAEGFVDTCWNEDESTNNADLGTESDDDEQAFWINIHAILCIKRVMCCSFTSVSPLVRGHKDVLIREGGSIALNDVSVNQSPNLARTSHPVMDRLPQE